MVPSELGSWVVGALSWLGSWSSQSQRSSLTSWHELVNSICMTGLSFRILWSVLLFRTLCWSRIFKVGEVRHHFIFRSHLQILLNRSNNQRWVIGEKACSVLLGVSSPWDFNNSEKWPPSSPPQESIEFILGWLRWVLKIWDTRKHGMKLGHWRKARNLTNHSKYSNCASSPNLLKNINFERSGEARLRHFLRVTEIWGIYRNCTNSAQVDEPKS